MTKRTPPSRPRIDTAEFARSGGELAGELTPAQLPRLRELLAGDEGVLRWALSGSRRRLPEGGYESFLELRLAGEMRQQCVRCLEPAPAAIDETRLFKLALTESQAEREDAEAEAFDVLASSPRFDVLELVEDEAIMALPIAPRHDDCRLPGAAAGAGSAGVGSGDGVAGGGLDEAPDERRNPFAALEKLKRR
jgi:uncharacterized protein